MAEGGERAERELNVDDHPRETGDLCPSASSCGRAADLSARGLRVDFSTHFCQLSRCVLDVP